MTSLRPTSIDLLHLPPHLVDVDPLVRLRFGTGRLLSSRLLPLHVLVCTLLAGELATRGLLLGAGHAAERDYLAFFVSTPASLAVPLVLFALRSRSRSQTMLATATTVPAQVPVIPVLLLVRALASSAFSAVARAAASGSVSAAVSVVVSVVGRRWSAAPSLVAVMSALAALAATVSTARVALVASGLALLSPFNSPS